MLLLFYVGDNSKHKSEKDKCRFLYIHYLYYGEYNDTLNNIPFIFNILYISYIIFILSIIFFSDYNIVSIVHLSITIS